MGDGFVPSNLEEAFVALEKILTSEQLHQLKTCKKEDLVLYHFGLGTWMRNEWGLWHNSPLAQDLVKRGVDHPDSMSGYIFKAFYDYLQKKEIESKIREKKERAVERPVISELDAASNFVQSTLHSVQNSWRDMAELLTDLKGAKFSFVDSEAAPLDFLYAIIALEFEAINNLYAPDQKGRIISWVLKYLDIPAWGEFTREEIKEYQRVFEKASSELYNNRPLDAVSARLLRRWLGEGIEKIVDKKTRIISPTVIIHVSRLLVSFLGFWKKITDEYDLVKTDLPINFDKKDPK